MSFFLFYLSLVPCFNNTSMWIKVSLYHSITISCKIYWDVQRVLEIMLCGFGLWFLLWIITHTIKWLIVWKTIIFAGNKGMVEQKRQSKSTLPAATDVVFYLGFISIWLYPDSSEKRTFLAFDFFLNSLKPLVLNKIRLSFLNYIYMRGDGKIKTWQFWLIYSGTPDPLWYVPP